MARRLAAVLILLAGPALAAGPAPLQAPEPPARPATVQPSPPRVVAPLPEAIICGDPRLIGRRRGNIVGPLPGCAILEPVQITKISGIDIQGDTTLDCRTARTVANWLTGVVVPEARRRLGSGVSMVHVFGSYSCRTRNNRPGARMSEHAVGRAIDVAGFTLTNGRRVTVLQNWGKGPQGAFLDHVWKKACGTFTTVLGPQADRFHQDHLHLDTAYRNSAFCR